MPLSGVLAKKTELLNLVSGTGHSLPIPIQGNARQKGRGDGESKRCWPGPVPTLPASSSARGPEDSSS